MPRFVLNWWNAQDAAYFKAHAALGALDNWASPFTDPATLAPIPIPAGTTRLSTVCEAYGNQHTFGPRPAGGTGFNAMGRANPWAQITGPPPAPPNWWVAVRDRSIHQLGYLASQPGGVGAAGPERFDRAIAGAWPNGLVAWNTHPAAIPSLVPGVVHNRPPAFGTRRYLARREILVFEEPILEVYWYHAISGGGPKTYFDLCDTLSFLAQRAHRTAHPLAGGAPPPVRRVVVLMGDLNLDPMGMDAILQSVLAGGPTPVGPHMHLGRNEFAILATGAATQRSGRELDYAFVYHHVSPGYAMPVPNVEAIVEVGYPPGPPFPAVWPPGGIPIQHFAPPPAAVTPFTSDHLPIRLMIDF